MTKTVHDEGCSCHYEPTQYSSRYGTVHVYPKRFDDPFCKVHRNDCRCHESFHPDGGIVRHAGRYCPIHGFEEYRTIHPGGTG